VNVKITKEEIVEACIEWAKNHHGLTVSSDQKPVFCLEKDGWGNTHVASLEMYEATGQPYR